MVPARMLSVRPVIAGLIFTKVSDHLCDSQGVFPLCLVAVDLKFFSAVGPRSCGMKQSPDSVMKLLEVCDRSI